MLGLFKKMLSRSEPAPQAPQGVPTVRQGAAPPLPKPRAKEAATRGTPVPPATPARPVTVAPAVSAVPETPNGTHVYVSLKSVAAGVPEIISHKVPANADQFVGIPLEMVVSQLPSGQIILTGAELRICSPEHFGALLGHEELPVTLPLADIVKQVPAQYFTRKNKRRVEVPAEVGSVFSANGQGVSIARQQAAAAAQQSPAPAAAPAPAQTSAAPAYKAQPAVTSTSAQPAPTPGNAPKISVSPQALAALKAATAAPTATAPAPAAIKPRSITPATSTPSIAPLPAAAATTPATPVAPILPAAAPTPTPEPAAAAPAPVVRKVTPTPAKPKGHLAIPLSKVCNEWDAEVRRQIADLDVEQHQIFVPLELLEPAMKSGKVLFSWSEVASWLKPELPSPPTPKVGEMQVDFPLKIVAPLFMASQSHASQKRVSIDETIPDLFGGNGGSNGQPSAQIPQRAAQPMPTPPARSITPAAPAAASAPQEAPVEQVIGPEDKRFGAKEIINNAAKLPGAAGALLAMSDGLLVTSNVPPTVKAETIAAFLPQMFGRMNQYTKELTLGPLQQLTLGVESGQWHIVKCPNVYFAVLGKRGETLPLNLLAQVAAELSSQSK